MHIFAAVCLSLLFLLGAPLGWSRPRAVSSSDQASWSEWASLNHEVQALDQQGQYDRAVVVAQQALAVAEKAVGPNHLAVAQSLNNLALLYETQGQYAQAE